jgi:hypothetical protein
MYELYGDLYKCVSCEEKQKEDPWFGRAVCDIYRSCGIDFCEKYCKCYLCIKCFGCPGCTLFDPYDFEFPENQSHMEECEDKLLNSVHQSTRTDKTSFKKIYCKKTDEAIDENEYVINSFAQERSLESLQTEFAVLRNATDIFFNTLNETQLHQKGIANNKLICMDSFACSSLWHPLDDSELFGRKIFGIRGHLKFPPKMKHAETLVLAEQC